ncbi:hypothetical protein JD844_013026 [Phrynosoma platyrhinos]|uniref:Uncharacterized protein n=1 Tax=Phrynosoma platyrhinos TaxID=52577 RepID=A0ABQ7TL53_PHRPL|nr:hypothetical protein JD844_013026 [Phrynosoma platyrhinos]
MTVIYYGRLNYSTNMTNFLFILQVLYRTSNQNQLSVLITNRTSAEILLPLNDDYIIEVKAATDGGDGISSEQIKIPKLARLTRYGCKRFWCSNLK